jgi:hypothetical protein
MESACHRPLLQLKAVMPPRETEMVDLPYCLPLPRYTRGRRASMVQIRLAVRRGGPLAFGKTGGHLVINIIVIVTIKLLGETIKGRR